MLTINRKALWLAAAMIGLLMFAGATSVLSQTAAAPAQGAPAQTDTSPPLPSFEVASIKHHAPDNSGGPQRVMMGGPPGEVSRWMASNVTAKMMIATAYGVREFQISGGPGWINSDHFDIDAKVEDSLAAQLQKLPRQQQQAQQALMLRSLLADRFKLQITRATKEGSVLALVVAKGGPKLKEVPPPDPQAGPSPPPTPAAPGQMPTPAPGQTMMMMNPNGMANLSSNAVAITALVNMLSVQLGEKVVDQTGLKGTYQYTLEFTAAGLGGMPPPPPGAGGDSAPDPNATSIYTALQEQLGLKLEETKAPIDTVTIEHIEEPTEN